MTELPNESEPSRGWISRYAWGKDYHDVMREKLERLRAALKDLSPTVETRVFVDTGPVVERAFARISGIGWTGKNTCLINEAKGSWFFLGVMLTSLELTPDLPAPDRCGSCTRCLEACPTGALVEPYVMDASRCIAYLNIELKGSIPEAFRPAMGANVVGCDICQDVCPWNAKYGSQEEGVRSQDGEQPTDSRHHRRTVTSTNIAEFQPLQVEPGDSALPPATRDPLGATDTRARTKHGFTLYNPPLEALAAMSENDFRRTFRRSPVKRVKYRGWLRNICVAMGNSGDVRFLPRLEVLAGQVDPIIREHAAWAIARLKGEKHAVRTDE